MNYILKDKKSIFIDETVKIGQNVIIYENNRISGGSVVEDNVTIFPNSYINNSIIGKGSKIYSSIIDNSKLGSCTFVGPFCFIKKAMIGNGVKVKAFTQLKNTRLLK